MNGRVKRVEWALYGLVVIIAALVLLLSIQAYHRFAVLQSHREYFREPGAQIQPWMTVGSVTRHFNISRDEILVVLQVNDSRSLDRTTIESICEQKRLNCTLVINDLNARKSHG